MKCAINLVGFQRFDEGTKFKINQGSKKCIFAKANLQNSLTILAAFFPDLDYLLAPSKSTCDITLQHVLSAKSSL
jgi:hypothetical protein